MTDSISVIIPAFNAERTIYRTLNSLYQCDYPKEKFEVILVDNNSTDETLLVASRFDVKVIKEERQGRSFARNRGVKESTGDLLFFIDADVFVEPDYFIESVKILQREGIGGVQGKIIPSHVDGQESINRYRYRTIEEATDGSFCLLNLMVRESPMINSAACGYKKEAFELVGGFDPGLERHEDIDLARRVLYSGFQLASAEKAVAHVVYHGEGWWSYFWRSFQDGYTKIDYNRKWALPIQFEGDQEDAAFLSSSFQTEKNQGGGARLDSTKRRKKKPPKFNKLIYVRWALGDLTRSLWGFISQREVFFLLLFINQNFKLVGRVCSGLRQRRHRGVLHLKLAPASIRLKKVKLKGGVTYALKPSLRYVLLLRHLYLVDTEGHQVLSDDEQYPYFFSYTTFNQLDLFKEFATNDDKDMIAQILQYKELLA